MESFAFKDRLPSALLALLIQGALIGLLIFSFQAVRQSQKERESILFLSRTPTRRAEPAATIIDASGALLTHNRSTKASVPPLLAQPDSTASSAAPTSTTALLPEALQSLGHAPFDCTPEKLAHLPPAGRVNCPPSVESMAKRDGSDVINSPYQAKNEAQWNEEMARKNAPVGLPGATSGPLGIVETLLTNPGAFADKRNYTYASRAPPPLSGADALHHATQVSPACPAMSDYERKACEINVVASLHIATAAPPSPPRIHASEAEFQLALKAYHQRRGIGSLVAEVQKPQ